MIDTTTHRDSVFHLFHEEMSNVHKKPVFDVYGSHSGHGGDIRLWRWGFQIGGS